MQHTIICIMGAGGFFHETDLDITAFWTLKMVGEFRIFVITHDHGPCLNYYNPANLINQ